MVKLDSETSWLVKEFRSLMSPTLTGCLSTISDEISVYDSKLRKTKAYSIPSCDEADCFSAPHRAPPQAKDNTLAGSVRRK